MLIAPGKRLDQVKAALIQEGFTEADVDAALEPTQWAKHPALTDKPEKANLEGYLYPESFQKTAETSARNVIKLSLDEMEARFTPQIRQAISKQAMTLHQAVITASIIEREVSSPEDRAQVAQVFKKRLAEKCALNPMLPTIMPKSIPPTTLIKLTACHPAR